MHLNWSGKFMETHISQENVGTNTLFWLLTMIILCLFYQSLQIFGQHLALSVSSFCGKIRMLPIFWENYQKYYRKPIYQHFSIYGQIIDIDLRRLEIIGDFKSLSISLALSKVPGKLSKIIDIEKNDLSLAPMHERWYISQRIWKRNYVFVYNTSK